MKNINDSTAISSELKPGEVDTEFILRSQHELERISEEQAFLWEMKQQNLQHSMKEQALFQELTSLKTVIKEQTDQTYALYDAVTFYKTKLFLDSDGTLRHIKINEEDYPPGNTIHVCLNKRNAALCTRINGEVYYIQIVNKDFAVQLVRNPVWNKINTNSDGSIVIQLNNGFLSANKDGNFQLSNKDSDLAHFWLQDHMVPIVLKLEGLIEGLDSRFSFPWSAVRAGSRIVIYGGGIVGKTYLRQLARSSYCSLVAICDQNPKETGIWEVPVISLQELYRMEPSIYDVILIATEKKKTAIDIREELELAGIPIEKVKWANPIREYKEGLYSIVNRSFANDSNNLMPNFSSKNVTNTQDNNAEKLRKSEILISELTTALNKEKKARSVDRDLLLKLRKYFTARIDIKFVSKTGQGDFQIPFVSDNESKIQKPKWFQKDGIGYQIESYAGKIEIITKATTDGQVQLKLRGLNVRDPEDQTKRLSYWVGYVNMAINGHNIFDKLTPAWHDKPYIYDVKVKANEETKIQVEWLHHKGD